MKRGDKNKIGLTFHSYGKSGDYAGNVYEIWTNADRDIICNYNQSSLTPITDRLANEMINRYNSN